jgi:hypothetical protein
MLGNYRVAAQLVTSRVVLCSTELVNTLQPQWLIHNLREQFSVKSGKLLLLAGNEHE